MLFILENSSSAHYQLQIIYKNNANSYIHPYHQVRERNNALSRHKDWVTRISVVIVAFPTKHQQCEVAHTLGYKSISRISQVASFSQKQ